MGRRVVPALLVALLLILHGQLWFGRGSIPNVRELRQKLAQQEASNAQARIANQRLAAEVSDLQEGLDTVEEKARSELGMLKPNEILVQIAK